ncbi:uncharacterized protein G2W53_010140 [Senna tora]|uniref:Uncharacterized protein n=1 Tax=Senna tora TaxID=362788 RepID=A0A834WZC5_9FABA|nr:uncharacterized protein G2W53_010140 [Senna tora]
MAHTPRRHFNLVMVDFLEQVFSQLVPPGFLACFDGDSHSLLSCRRNSKKYTDEAMANGDPFARSSFPPLILYSNDAFRETSSHWYFNATFQRKVATVSLTYSELSLLAITEEDNSKFLNHFCKKLASISFAYSELRPLATSE